MKQEKQIETGTGKTHSVVRAYAETKNGLRTPIRCLLQHIPFLLVFCVVLLLISGCGKKSVPRAPELVLPEPINDLRAQSGKDWAPLV